MFSKLPIEIVNHILEYDTRFFIHYGKISIRLSKQDIRYRIIQTMLRDRRNYKGRHYTRIPHIYYKIFQIFGGSYCDRHDIPRIREQILRRIEIESKKIMNDVIRELKTLIRKKRICRIYYR
jgi:hypothetical protein